MPQYSRPVLAHSRPDVPITRPLMGWAPPSGALLNTILQYADITTDMGGGRSLLRLSPARMADPVIAEPLGREAGRLADVAILWDEREAEIVRVMDHRSETSLAIVMPGPVSSTESEPQFELTDEALAYIASLETDG